MLAERDGAHSAPRPFRLAKVENGSSYGVGVAATIASPSAVRKGGRSPPDAAVTAPSGT